MDRQRQGQSLTTSNSSSNKMPRDYQTLKILGQGAFGKVYLMRHLPTGREVCVKVVKHKEVPAACLQEVHIMQQLVHPNIIRYQESFQTGTLLFIIMQYADSGDLGMR